MSDGKRFTFSTKAETLARLAPLVRASRVLDLHYFTVQDWREGADSILRTLAERFGGGRVIVRSSAIGEDGGERSLAGAYLSVIDVGSADEARLRDAVESVAASYEGNPRDQILVQPLASGVALSGVMMTRDLDTGAPYYVVNYDDESGKTDSITGGHRVNKTLFVYRGARAEYVRSERIARILAMAAELEEICGPVPLDIEFGLDREGEALLFQVRRISAWKNWHAEVATTVDERLPHVERFVVERSAPRPGIAGSSNAFGVMPDWNPGELIGVTPNRLAASLYRRLITGSAWRVSRASMGYRELPGEELMVLIGGRPYIDIRNSFNSFLPAGLDDGPAGRLVDAWLERLREHPELHDKVEFEIVQSCLDFTFEEDFAARFGGVLGAAELAAYSARLAEITRRALEGDGPDSFTAAERSIERLALRQRERPLPGADEPGGPEAILRAAALLDECWTLGTVPFAVIARHAFIAETLLRSAVRRGALGADRLDQLKRSIRTVSGSFSEELRAVCEGLAPQDAFLARYGHLRPGTYDIKSLRYVDREDLFRDCVPPVENGGHTDFVLAGSEEEAISRLMEEAGLGCTGAGLVAYARRAVGGREYAKFVFSRNLSDALEAILRWGEAMGLSREHLSHLPVEEILAAAHAPPLRMELKHFLESAEDGRRASADSRALKLGHLIREVADVYLVPQHRTQPNFIGAAHVRGPVVLVTAATMGDVALYDRIVCIEGADPGFDWIFTKQIRGLVTKYGGVNSHMAIRCAEYGLPAAIGCGEQLFTRLVAAGSADLNCAEKVLAPTHG